MEYKLHKTDNKTFFTFRNNPESVCDSFTVNYLEDGTTVMSGDYGTLCWRRGSSRDYGFPNAESGVNYFAEKIVQWGVPQKIKEWNKAKALEQTKKLFEEQEIKGWEDFKESVQYLEEWEEYAFSDALNEYLEDVSEYELGIRYTSGFLFRMEVLVQVSKQILEAVNQTEVKD